MSLTKKEIEKIAKLARIKLNEEQAETFKDELSGILDWVEQLQEVDTENVEPLTSISNVVLPTRKDEVTEKNVQEEVLSNAPNSQYGYFTVPKVVE